MNMPAREYNEFYRIVRDWNGSKEGLQNLYDEIYNKYDDGKEILQRVDSMYQRKWVMNLH